METFLVLLVIASVVVAVLVIPSEIMPDPDFQTARPRSQTDQATEAEAEEEEAMGWWLLAEEEEL